MKHVRQVIALILAVAIISSLSVGVLAADGDVDAGTEVVGLATAAAGIYEASVIAQMVGRAGTSISGAKGIAFEILYKDVKNLQNLFSPGTSTQLSASSTDTIADLITTNGDDIIEFIQCKDGTSSSQITDMIKRVTNGQYEHAELVATRECAEAFNEKAAAAGLDVTAKDSGISTNLTSRIGEIYNKAKISASNAVKDAVKSAGVAAVITFCCSVADSIINGDDFSKATGNVTAETATSAISVCVGSLSKTAMYNLLAATGVPSTMCAAAPGVVCFLVATAGSYTLHILIEEFQVKEWIAEQTDIVCAKAAEFAFSVSSFVTSAVVPGAINFYESVTDGAKEALQDGKNVTESAWQYATSFFNKTSSAAGSA